MAGTVKRSRRRQARTYESTSFSPECNGPTGGTDRPWSCCPVTSALGLCWRVGLFCRRHGRARRSQRGLLRPVFGGLKERYPLHGLPRS